MRVVHAVNAANGTMVVPVTKSGASQMKLGPPGDSKA